MQPLRGRHIINGKFNIDVGANCKDATSIEENELVQVVVDTLQIGSMSPMTRDICFKAACAAVRETS